MSAPLDLGVFFFEMLEKQRNMTWFLHILEEPSNLFVETHPVDLFVALLSSLYMLTYDQM